MGKITYEEYEKANEIVGRYEYQCKPKKVQVSVTYEATASMTFSFPAEWDIKRIKKELKDGPWYGFEKEDEESIDYGKIIELIVDGEIIIELDEKRNEKN